MNDGLYRRTIIRHGMQGAVGTAIAIALGACGRDNGETIACADPENLSRSQLSMRDSLSYADLSPDATKACAKCAYFNTNESQSGCGACDILGGQVSSRGFCNSWSAKS